MNSRAQKRANNIWRRRQCDACRAVFTTIEQTVYESAVAVRYSTSHIIPFARDKLFLSIYDACKHRPTGIEDAGMLTDSIILRLLQAIHNGSLDRKDIARESVAILERFDHVAATHYRAFHPVDLKRAI